MKKAIFQNKNGFTLIEIVISVMILAFVSVFTAQTIRQSLLDKNKMQKDIDQRAQLHNALKLMERDINLAFHYRGSTALPMLEIQRLQALAEQKKAQASAPVPPNVPAQQQPGTAAPTPVEPTAAPYKTLSQFIGDDKSLALTSLGNFRSMKDSQKSDQMEVGYYLDGCPSQAIPGSIPAEGQCLYRRVDDVIDDDVTKGGTPSVLLENVQEMHLRYLGKGKEDWVSSWYSNEKGDAVTKDQFPNAVEITITTQQNKKQITLSTVAEVRFPNNDDSKRAGGTNAAQPTR